MTLEEAIYARLSGAAPVAALVGTRIYPILAPQGAALPYVVFTRQETENLAHLGGRGTHDRVQVTVQALAEDTVSARAVAAALQDALDEWSGHAVVASSRLVGRVQATIAETETTPRISAESLLLTILCVET